nr:hypothetical protein [Tanacetum cinerariifolium]
MVVDGLVVVVEVGGLWRWWVGLVIYGGGGDRWSISNGVWSGAWSWRVPPRGRTLDDLSNLINLIGNVSPSIDADDKWVWMIHPLGAFNLKALSSMIQNKVLIDCNLGKHHVCNSWVSRKINVCTWRASLNWLLTLVNFVNRGFVLPSQPRQLCKLEDETIDHCMFNCFKVNLFSVREIADLEDIFLSIQNSSLGSLPAIKIKDIFSSIQRLSRFLRDVRSTQPSRVFGMVTRE